MKERLERAWNKVIELWYTPYYLWLYWSQNYNLDTEESDFDYKCIILPTLDDLVNQTKPTSIIIDFEWWQIEIKDIRNYVESAVKVNVNFIEILSTPHYLWCPDIRKFFEPLLNELWTQYLRACMWMIMQKYHALERPFESKLKEIEKFWYDPKQLCHIVRLRTIMERRVCDTPSLSFTHEWDEKDCLLLLKKWHFWLDSARLIAKSNIEKAESILADYKWVDTYKTKEEMIKWSRELIIKNIRLNQFK